MHSLYKSQANISRQKSVGSWCKTWPRVKNQSSSNIISPTHQISFLLNMWHWLSTGPTTFHFRFPDLKDNTGNFSPIIISPGERFKSINVCHSLMQVMFVPLQVCSTSQGLDFFMGHNSSWKRTQITLVCFLNPTTMFDGLMVFSYTALFHMTLMWCLLLQCEGFLHYGQLLGNITTTTV